MKIVFMREKVLRSPSGRTGGGANAEGNESRGKGETSDVSAVLISV